MTRDEIVRLIGSIIDHPSVYMGGASQQSMRKAKRILEALAASGYAVVPVEATMNMRWAGRQHFIEQSGGKQFLSTVNVADFWRAMLTAAQEDN